jgi:ABC-type glycerol-3-phosphate transport system substrate-binding protein
LLNAAQKLTVRDTSGWVVQYGWTDSGLNMWPWVSLKYKVAPNIAELQQVPFRDLFMSGRVAMIYDAIGAQASYVNIKDFAWGVSEMAMGKQRAVGMTENGWAIVALTKNPKQA